MDLVDPARKTPQVLVLVPTRELAVQIHNDAIVLGKHTGLRLACVFGGVDYDKQRKKNREQRWTADPEVKC